MIKRDTDGKISDSVRRTQALPLSWDIPAATEIENLRLQLWKLTDRGSLPPAPTCIEGAILLVLCMQTGESSPALFGALRGSGAPAPAPSLLLTSAEGKSTIALRPLANAPPIYLPQTMLLTRLLAMLPPLSEPYGPVFNPPWSDVEDAASKLVRSGDDWLTRTPKAARSLLAHSRWLFRRLREASNGDPALVAMLKPDRHAAEKTLTAYCAVPQKTLVQRYRRAIRPLGCVSPMPQNNECDEYLTGSIKLPSDDLLKHDILGIRKRLASPMIVKSNVIKADKLLGPLPITRDWHIAMMAYTYVLTTFGTGQRGKKAPCGELAIDRESGFSWVVEKGKPGLGLAGARGVFHCQTVREQLARYEDYLDILMQMLEGQDGCLASDLQTLRGDGKQLAFFDIRAGKLVKLTPYGLCKAAGAIGWQHDAGMGRRWLRSQLTAALPSDALGAQFGHNLDGVDVWSPHSGLQVRALPAILGPAIERRLSGIGLEPSSARAPEHRPKLDETPDTEIIIKNTRERSGQLLASMIWHGALLQPDQHEAALEALKGFDPSQDPLPWILLDAPFRDTERWVLDPVTVRLMKRYRENNLPISSKLDKVINEYFKSRSNFDAFVTAAMTRWRYKLPPILYAKAVGNLKNSDLPNDQVQKPLNGKSKSPDPKLQRRSFTPSAWNMIDWLTKRQLIKCDRKRGYKRLLYSQLRAEVTEQTFWAEMPMLERWLTLASIELIVADRGKKNTAGYALSTIIEQAKRVFGHFANQDVAKYRNLALDKWQPEQIERYLPQWPFRYDVAMDLDKLIKAYAGKDENADILDMLNKVVENRKSFVVTHDLYRKISANEHRPDQRVALALCYKAGVRLGELHAIDKDMFADHEATFTLRLDHKPNRRLKTFHSRRIIPLDVFLDVDEQEYLRALLKKTQKWLFPLWHRAEHVLKDAVKLAAQPLEISAWALRHSFATNAYASLLWPDSQQPLHAAFFDPVFLSGSNAVRVRLCGKASLGAIGPHALATVMGHTSPSRTLYNYAHNLEFILAAHVATWQKDKSSLHTSLRAESYTSPPNRVQRIVVSPIIGTHEAVPSTGPR